MGKPVEEGSAARRRTSTDPALDLDILEQTISIEGARALRRDAYGLVAAPIPQAWVLEGSPAARFRRLAGSSDQTATTVMWDCTAGRFNWFYDEDEVIHVLEGYVIIEDAAGVRQRLQAGDTFLFAAGTHYQWTVPNYIRKVAFLHEPLTRELRIVRGILRRLTSPFRRKPAGAVAWGS